MKSKTVTGSLLFWHKFLANTRLQVIVIAAMSLMIYANTFTHEYAQDDAIVIYDNMFTTQGIKGIPGIFKHDTFFGFFKDKSKAGLVEGGRYRPLTPAMFALEYSLFGNSPTAGHILNVCWYLICGLILYFLLRSLLIPFYSMENGIQIAFIATILFVAHPIHTEAVANIKGRDEIMSLLLSLSAMLLILKYLNSKNWMLLAFSGLLFFAGLLSKENTITFLFVIPLGLYLFKSVHIKELILPLSVLVTSTVLFLIIRYNVLDLNAVHTSDSLRDLMNDPFVKWNGTTFVPFEMHERFATIIYTLGKYLSILVFPHPLTNDYYPRHIEIMQFFNWKVILSTTLYVSLGVLSIIWFRKRRLISFSIWYFFATTSIISNIFFPVGTNMAERFMFMPSIAFVLVTAGLLNSEKKSVYQKPALFVFLLIVILFSFKTIDRNRAWQNDFTLFTTDVKTSKNSAKALNAAGGALSTSVIGMEESDEKEKRLSQAKEYLERAISIHPRYRNAFLLLGNTHYYYGSYEEAIKYYDQTLQLSPGYADAIKNRSIAYRDAGRYFGEKEQNLPKALFYLEKAYIEMPDDIETLRLLGVCNGIMNNHEQAQLYFEKWTQLSPDNAHAWKNLMHAAMNNGNQILALQAREKVLTLDPSLITEE